MYTDLVYEMIYHIYLTLNPSWLDIDEDIRSKCQDLTERAMKICIDLIKNNYHITTQDLLKMI